MEKEPNKPHVFNVVTSADHAALEDAYTFIPSQAKPSSWQQRMVQRYHEGLYKEFALADLSMPGKLGLRWRTRQEVVDGRGERSCGNKVCHASSNLLTLEVPFSYQEDGVLKKELVKLRLCQSCQPFVKNSTCKTTNHSKEDKRTSKRSFRDGGFSEENSFSDTEQSLERRRRRKRTGDSVMTGDS